MSCYYEAGQVDAACRLGRSYEKVLSNRQKQILIGPCR
jgi:hypothetical protein